MLKLRRNHHGSSTNESTRSSDDCMFTTQPPMTSEKLGRHGRRSRYRGVVPQPNGRWGAQIYEKGQRIWLGTYNEEGRAAIAYDVAAQRVRGDLATLNFFRTEMAEEDGHDVEAKFLRSHSREEVVQMLRMHTYKNELERVKQNYCLASCQPAPLRRVLFQKSVTASDVGKQNRFVIPKKYAEKHFASKVIRLPAEIQTHNATPNPKGLKMLNFRDVDRGAIWRFRFSYWKRSRSYVLTRGWSRFVKEKKLEAGDVVSFQQSTGPDKRMYVYYSKPTGKNPTNETARVMRLFGVDIVLDGGAAVMPLAAQLGDSFSRTQVLN